MSISMYQASVPVFTRTLQNLITVIEKSAVHCEAHKIQPESLLFFRLYPDMFHFARQVQAAADHAKNGAARLAGIDGPAFENHEKSFAELIERLQRTIDWLNTLQPEQIDGSETREVVLKRGEHISTYAGQTYLLQRALPNLFFHATTAYDILRHNGVALGKRDFLGG